jgi:type IV pilus assembly protein PilV
MDQRPAARGFSLLEVLIALLVFSLGMLGMAGLLVVSVRANHSAFLRTQASFLAQSMADRMRANMPRVWAGDYADTYPTDDDPDTCGDGATCARSAVATRDKGQWSQQLSDLLPDPTAKISCTATGTGTFTATAKANGAPYDGLCTMTIAWKEASLDSGATSVPTQSFVWKFQP